MKPIPEMFKGFILTKIKQRLTDGSHVFDVRLQDGDGAITFECYTEERADELIDTLTATLSNCTTSAIHNAGPVETEA